MSMNPLADALSLIKNAQNAGKKACLVKPASKMIGNTLAVMQKNGYIEEIERIEDGRGGLFKVSLAGKINDCKTINPRFAVKAQDMEKWEARYLPARNFGNLILTTNNGVISNDEAKEKGIGGRLLAYVY